MHGMHNSACRSHCGPCPRATYYAILIAITNTLYGYCTAGDSSYVCIVVLVYMVLLATHVLCAIANIIF